MRAILRWIKPMRVPAFALATYAEMDRALIGPKYSEIADELARTIRGKILDVGCGPGYLTLAIVRRTRNVSVIGIDINADMVARARADAAEFRVPVDRAYFERMDAHDLKFPAETFDCAVCVGLLHHLKNPVKALNELHRVLKKGGVAWIYDTRSDASEAEIKKHVEYIRERLKLARIGRIAKAWITMIAKRELTIDSYTIPEMLEIVEKSKFKDFEVMCEGVWAKLTLKK